MTVWKKSARSGSAGGNCVELARLDASSVGVRNSRFPQGTVLTFPAPEIAEFVRAIKASEFDDLISPEGN